MYNALIIIDVQNAFFKGGELQVCENVNDILLNIVELQNKNFFDHVIVTQHIYPTKKFLNRETLVANTHGVQLHEKINKNNIDLLITKQTYSAFDKTNTLSNYLELNKITCLYLCGVAYDWCVKETAISAIELGYKVKIIKSATKAYDKITENNTDLLLTNKNIEIIEMIDITKFDNN